MKKNPCSSHYLAALLGCLALFNSGCGKNQQPRPARAADSPPSSRRARPALPKSPRSSTPAEIFIFTSAPRNGWNIFPTKREKLARHFHRHARLEARTTPLTSTRLLTRQSPNSDSGVENVSGVGHEFRRDRERPLSQQGAAASLSRQGDGFIWKFAAASRTRSPASTCCRRTPRSPFLPTPICRCFGTSRKRKSPNPLFRRRMIFCNNFPPRSRKKPA